MFLPYYAPLDWKDYLQSQHIVDGVNLGLEGVSKSLQRSGQALHFTLSEGLRQLVGSNENIARVMQGGFGRLEDRLGNVYSAIEGLGASFSYDIGLVVDQLIITNQTLEGIERLVQKIEWNTANPLQNSARERFSIGCENLKDGLLVEAVERFQEAVDKHKENFFAHFSLGKLYLYGKNEKDDVIDVKKAEEHFRLAIRYGEAKLGGNPERKILAEAYFHASMVCYLQGEDNNRYTMDESLRKTIELNGGNAKEELDWERCEGKFRKLVEAHRLAVVASELNPELAEAHYHAAKYSAAVIHNNLDYFLKSKSSMGSLKSISYRLGNKMTDLHYQELSENHLSRAIALDRKYVLKASLDRDFDYIPLEPCMDGDFDYMKGPYMPFDLFMTSISARLKRESKVEERLEQLCKYLQEPEPQCMDRANLQKLQDIGLHYSKLWAYIKCKWTREPFDFGHDTYTRGIDERFEKIRAFRGHASKISTETSQALKTGGYLDILSSVEAMSTLEKKFEEYERERKYVKVYDPKFHSPEQLLEAGKSYADLVYDRFCDSRCVYCGQEQEGFHLFGGLDEGWLKHEGLLACNKENRWNRSASKLEEINAAYTFFRRI